jgi:hypothetical protein
MQGPVGTCGSTRYIHTLRLTRVLSERWRGVIIVRPDGNTRILGSRSPCNKSSGRSTTGLAGMGALRSLHATEVILVVSLLSAQAAVAHSFILSILCFATAGSRSPQEAWAALGPELPTAGPADGWPVWMAAAKAHMPW